MKISQLRRQYHERICNEIIRIKTGTDRKKQKVDYPNFADVGNDSSIQIAWEIFNKCSGIKLKIK
ncbi:hypothetical protein GWN91_01165 [Candidatus Saccharibacteria bacterium]|nr:hypothetical protein [Candidatus Saccharibacteria bacterium]NIV73215.1 hypothetical protein [Calditrichia bacterium]NIW78288.1 hypothetical protein [Calditrichia bacterium]